MEIKVVNLGKDKINAGIKISTEHSDICVIPDIDNLSQKGKKELYNSKWIVNCRTLEDFTLALDLAKELRPKQLFIVDLTEQLDEISLDEIKSWRGQILKMDDLLELKIKPNEGFFLDNSQWNMEEGKVTSFQLEERFRIEGRVFILCRANFAYGELRMGKVTKVENDWFRYEIDKFEPFETPKLLNLPGDKVGLFLENIENYYIQSKPEEKEVIDKPYPNEHSCRLKSPRGFIRFRRSNCAQRHDGKCIDVIYGITSAQKAVIQALRYKTKIWKASSARSHCKSRGGSFEAAGKSLSTLDKGMSRQDWLDAWKEDPHWATFMKPSPLAKHLVSEMERKEITGKILEIGCGNGRDSIYFGKQDYAVTGIDISPDAIKIAKENNKNSKVRFMVGDAEKLAFSDNSFSAVYSISVLHSTDLKKSIKELSRVLKEKGLSVLYLYNKSTYSNEEKTEINFKIGELEELFDKHELKIVDKWKDKLKDEDKEGKHIHNIVIYSLEKI